MPIDLRASRGCMQGTSPTSLTRPNLCSTAATMVLARDAAGGCREAHGLSIAAVEGEGHAYALAVVAADLQAVRAPAGISRASTAMSDKRLVLEDVLDEALLRVLRG